MKVPVGTYRLQLGGAINFVTVRSLFGYLAKLGISDIYASPIFQAAKGSTHGYDVADHNALNEELGTAAQFEAMCAEREKAGLGWVQDIVPNHSTYSSENTKLMDVFENGQTSRYYNFFDIDWNHPHSAKKGRVLAPFLGDMFATCLENGVIRLEFSADGFAVHFYEMVFPLRMETYPVILSYNLAGLKQDLGKSHPDYLKLLGVIYVLKNLSMAADHNERHEQVMFIKRMLWELYNSDSHVKKFFDANIKVSNGEAGRAESFNLLDGLLADQVFRLSFWKVGTEEINYRRFFGLNNLICVKVEEQDVFEIVHDLTFKCLTLCKFSGLRVDHIDGLWDPAKYIDRLRSRAGDVYLVVEKILAINEQLNSDWAVQGTTGYDFMNYVNGIFCDHRNEKKFDRIYRSFAGIRGPYESLVQEKKRVIIRMNMMADIDNLAIFIKSISSQDRYGSDITLSELRRGLIEVLTNYDVYRTYISFTSYSENDKTVIDNAIAKARKQSPELENGLNFIERFLMLALGKNLPGVQRDQWIRMIMRLQQYTGPLMAKGFEDTLLYVYDKLISLNEVGSDPSRFGVMQKQFHEFNSRRRATMPLTMNTTSTHDTKRGEDVRCRINVLSEMPGRWEEAVKAWREMNNKIKPTVNGVKAPDRNDEYFLYQTLVGVYPFDARIREDFVTRIKQYMVKVVREAKTHSQWIKPDEEYENALVKFIDSLLEERVDNEFLASFKAFAKEIRFYGVFNSLSQLVLKATCPGVPDFYQGSELWDLSLVDPDNRRPVDFERRKAMLEELEGRLGRDREVCIREMLARSEDGMIKMFVMRESLGVRRQMREVFERGEYVPLYALGASAGSVIAFARVYKGRWAVTIAGRFLTRVAVADELPVGSKWGDTSVEIRRGVFPAEFTDAFTKKKIKSDMLLRLERVFEQMPLGLLTGEVGEKK